MGSPELSFEIEIATKLLPECGNFSKTQFYRDKIVDPDKWVREGDGLFDLELGLDLGLVVEKNWN